MKRPVFIGMFATGLYLSGGSLFGQSNIASLETAKVVAQALEKTITIPGDLTAYRA
jgi:hypothetical protein